MNNIILFSTRELQLTYGESCYHNPCFLFGEGWYWLVNYDFGVWVYRAITNAKLNNALTPELLAKYEPIRKALRDAYGASCDSIPAAAKNPVALAPIPPEWFSEGFLAHVGLNSNPPWPTFEADRARFCTTPRGEPTPETATAAVENAVVTVTDEKTRPTTTLTKTDHKSKPAGLFAA